MKRTCYNCRALLEHSRGAQCMLGYKISKVEKKMNDIGKIYVPTPTEECLKPTTWKKYFFAKQKIQL